MKPRDVRRHFRATEETEKNDYKSEIDITK